MKNLQEQAAEALLDLSQKLRVHGYAQGLKPGQWAAMRYLSRAPAPGRTLSAFAAHRGISLGAAVQTINSLAARDYIRRSIDQEDRRRRPLELTDAGQEVLKNDPTLLLLDALRSISVERIWMTDQTIRQIVNSLTGSRDAVPVGEFEERSSGGVRQRNHDVRVMLTTIIGMADAMQKEELGPIASDIYREYSTAIRQCGEKLLELLDTPLSRVA